MADAHSGGLLEGKSCVVTGGANGIGRAVAQRFVEEGANVVVGDIDERAAAAVAEQLAADGTTVGYAALDVRDRRSVEAALATARTAFDGVDVLVANAGILRQDRVLDMAEEAWTETLAVNLTGVFNCCQTFGRAMVAQGRGGRIIITSSIAGLVGGSFYGAYASSKFGVIGLSQCLAAELAEHDILVNCVCPGSVDTRMMTQVATEQAAATNTSVGNVVDATLGRIALNRYADPREVADAYVYLASPLARYVTGQRIVVDGGMLIE